MTRKQEEHITDEASFNKFFTMIENMADEDLGPYEYRLLAHYKCVCGQNGGKCTESTKKTAETCHMSTGKVSSTRKTLEEMGWISMRTISKLSDNGNPQIVGLSITLINRMAENVERYSARYPTSPDEHPTSPDETNKNKDQESIKEEKRSRAQKRTRTKVSPEAIAICDAWWNAIPEAYRPNYDKNFGRDRKIAEAIHTDEQPFTAEQVAKMVTELYAKGRFKNDIISMAYIRSRIKAYFAPSPTGERDQSHGYASAEAPPDVKARFEQKRLSHNGTGESS